MNSPPAWWMWAVVGAIIWSMTGCAELERPSTQEDVPYSRPLCTFGQGGNWHSLNMHDPNTGKITKYLAIIPQDMPIDLDHVLCLIPHEEPIMALGKLKGKES